MEDGGGKAVSDVRLRILSLTALSLLVFFVPAGFAAGLFWWLLFSGISLKQRGKALLAAFLISAIPTLVLLLFGDEAIHYGAKTFVLLLLAFWFGQTYAAGEFQSFFVWLLGRKFGFDVGMACENIILQTSLIADDVRGFRLALRQKGKRFGISHLPSFAFGLLVLSLRRAELSAKLLARRGYVSGGTFEPVFSITKSEISQTVFAGILSVLSLLPLLFPW